jgi:hypothetical protein
VKPRTHGKEYILEDKDVYMDNYKSGNEDDNSRSLTTSLFAMVCIALRWWEWWMFGFLCWGDVVCVMTSSLEKL